MTTTNHENIAHITPSPLDPREIPLTAAEAAARLRCAPSTIKRLCKAGELPGARVVLGKWLIPRAALEAYAAGPGAPPAPIVVCREAVDAVLRSVRPAPRAS